MGEREKIINELMKHDILITPEVLGYIIARGGMQYIPEFLKKYGQFNYVYMDDDKIVGEKIKCKIVAYFDGACEPRNPRGIATYGFVVYIGNVRSAYGYGLATKPFSPNATNNVAEYRALVELLENLVFNGYEDCDVTIRGDSQLVINQMNSIWDLHSENIKPLYEKAQEYARDFTDLKFEWIPREQNEEADELSHRAFEEYVESHPEVILQLEKMLATDRQKELLNKLGIPYYKYIGKREASRLIKRKITKNP